MDYQILYPEAFPVVSCHLRQGEAIKAESDAMIAMSPNVQVQGRMEGGVLSSLTRRFLTGESFFLQTLTASRGDGRVLFGPKLPGGITDVALDGSYGLIVEKGGFLAAEPSIAIDSKMQGLLQGMFSREGFLLLKLTGRGIAFLSSYGVIHPIELQDGEEVIIDNGHLVAWADYLDYKIEKAASGWLSSFTSGEGLVCRFRGPGIVLIQTRNPEAFAQWIQSLTKQGGNS